MNAPQLASFPGGLLLEAHKEALAGAALRDGPLPESVVLPLDQHAGVPARPCVAIGDRVLRGTPVAQPGDLRSAALHAPISGTVVATDSHVDRETRNAIVRAGVDAASAPAPGAAVRVRVPPLLHDWTGRRRGRGGGRGVQATSGATTVQRPRRT